MQLTRGISSAMSLIVKFWSFLRSESSSDKALMTPLMYVAPELRTKTKRFAKKRYRYEDEVRILWVLACTQGLFKRMLLRITVL